MIAARGAAARALPRALRAAPSPARRLAAPARAAQPATEAPPAAAAAAAPPGPGTDQQLRARTAAAGTAFTLGDEKIEPPPGGATYADLRRRPINYSPETPFTVDNAAEADAARFRLHPSVDFWRSFGTRFDSRSIGNDFRGSGSLGPESSDVLGMLSASALADAESAAYWAYHLGRTGFFLVSSAAGAVAHHLTETLSGGGRRTPFQNLTANARAEVENRLKEGVAMFSQDLANIKAGAYKLPWDMTTPTHRQFNPAFVARKAATFVGEAVETLNRRLSRGDTSPWFNSTMYPDYYMQNTFHYQTDGWLSARSAGVYEFSTESLFFGRQDSMQRTALLALREWMEEEGRDAPSVRLLEVACGTGRFHTFVKDNYPGMQTVASDLSPFYLSAARDNLGYWKRTRQPDARLGGGPFEAGTKFLQCPAEAVPEPDESFDAVLCVYLFHELPESARLAAAKEWARLLKPGGTVVLVDSCQLGDRPAWDPTLGAFGEFNEPHYRNYIACDMGALFEAAGLQPRTKYLASATKVWSFVKPRTAGGEARTAGGEAPMAGVEARTANGGSRTADGGARAAAADPSLN
ncbi:S-adenosyl-L-methionine-dependent methyltransferase [Raphidocelis subcapitata]|uniref:S-adenosyl-L-methionine-dependent methyltransferase n=1 Tax=Raphidocelis subcapitata TaxID=307507 RepID=A0A2V0P5R4_9CHLO|nr:S-adenosyl-L-methionine-dependent methyltransferase [Raphidocelis subcapitata]|eukprot:GBF94272.1 S-adenosyl-L-methionine-dependent methyltransferase [Raphidocelis subcapitata]